MWRMRAAMATTSFVAVREREKGLAGRGIEVASLSGLERSWKWRVESQEAEINMAGRWEVSLLSVIGEGAQLTVFFAVND